MSRSDNRRDAEKFVGAGGTAWVKLSFCLGCGTNWSRGTNKEGVVKLQVAFLCALHSQPGTWQEFLKGNLWKGYS